MDVKTDYIHILAKSLVLLENVDGFSSGDRTIVANSANRITALVDETAELVNVDEPLENSLITDNEEINQMHLIPGDNILELVVSNGARTDTIFLDEDSKDEPEAVLLTSTANSLQAVTVRGVQANGLEVLVSNGLDVSVNILSGLARLIVVVRRVRNGISLARGLCRRGFLLGGSLLNNRSGLVSLGFDDFRLLFRSASWGSDWDDSSGGLNCSKRAGHDIVGLGNGGDNIIMSIGTRDNDSNDGVFNNDRGRSNCGGGANGVGSGSRADEGGGGDLGSDDTLSCLNDWNRADDSRGSSHDSCNTSVSLGSWRKGSGLWHANCSSLRDSNGSGRDGVGTRLLDGSDVWSRHGLSGLGHGCELGRGGGNGGLRGSNRGGFNDGRGSCLGSMLATQFILKKADAVGKKEALRSTSTK